MLPTTTPAIAPLGGRLKETLGTRHSKAVTRGGKGQELQKQCLADDLVEVHIIQSAIANLGIFIAARKTMEQAHGTTIP